MRVAFRTVLGSGDRDEAGRGGSRLAWRAAPPRWPLRSTPPSLTYEAENATQSESGSHLASAMVRRSESSCRCVM